MLAEHEQQLSRSLTPPPRPPLSATTLQRRIAVVSADGSYLKANYAKGGEALRVAYSHFVTPSAGAAQA